MKNIHPLQEKIYAIYKNNNGVLPTFRKLAKLIGVSSTNTVSYHIGELKRKGYFSTELSANGIVEFNLKNLIEFESKSGVYVLLRKNIPFSIDESENIKNDLIKKLGEIDSAVLKEIKENPVIDIAYYLIEDKEKRKDLKKHLLDYYSRQGINFKE